MQQVVVFVEAVFFFRFRFPQSWSLVSFCTLPAVAAYCCRRLTLVAAFLFTSCSRTRQAVGGRAAGAGRRGQGRVHISGDALGSNHFWVRGKLFTTLGYRTRHTDVQRGSRQKYQGEDRRHVINQEGHNLFGAPFRANRQSFRLRVFCQCNTLDLL